MQGRLTFMRVSVRNTCTRLACHDGGQLSLSLSLRAEQNVPSVRRRNIPRRVRGSKKMSTTSPSEGRNRLKPIAHNGRCHARILHSEFKNAFMQLASTINGQGFGDKFSNAPWTLHQLLVWFVLAWGPRHSGISSDERTPKLATASCRGCCRFQKTFLCKTC